MILVDPGKAGILRRVTQSARLFVQFLWLIRAAVRRARHSCAMPGMIRHSDQEVIPMAKVEIYTQPWCPFCERAMHVLATKNVEFHEIDAPHGSAARDEAKRRSGGRTTMPQIFIDGQHIGGCDDLMALDRAGKLDPLLTAA
jgi:glutaredoxin 3